MRKMACVQHFAPIDHLRKSSHKVEKCESVIVVLHILKHKQMDNKTHTVETCIKEPVFMRTFRLKFNLLNPLAETRRGSYITGFLCSEFLRI